MSRQNSDCRKVIDINLTDGRIEIQPLPEDFKV